MRSLEIVEIGDGLGIILPSDILAKFQNVPDGTVYLTETNDGITLTSIDPTAASVDSPQ